MDTEARALADGMRLEMHSYQLDPEAGRAFGIPAGSYERVIVLREAYGDVMASWKGATDPAASWGLEEEDFRQLYGSIQDEEDFIQARDFMDLHKRRPGYRDKILQFLESRRSG